MIIGRVVGHLVATAKHPSFAGQKLLLVVPESPDGKIAGDELIAVDGAGAGIGERVLVVIEGRAAGDIMEHPLSPVDAAIIGIVDRIDLAADRQD